MRTVPPAVLPLFRSELQARLLSVLLLGDGGAVASPELARRTGASPASLHRELQRLERAGLIEHERVGRTKVYRAAERSPVHAALRELLERTVGVESMLRARLASLPGVEAAAIFGSWAAGRVSADSDVDVLVVGDVERDHLLEAAREVERIAGRAVNVAAYDAEEFARRRDDGFLATVLARPLIPLVGSL